MKKLRRLISLLATTMPQFCVVLALNALATTALLADEGMWPFDNIPVADLQQRYDATLNQEDIDHLRLSCLRLSSGGSASFVSPHGLVMTNHHVGFKTILDLSTAENNFLADGFYASTLAEELCCPNLYADQLCEIRNITDEILDALPDSGPSEREQAYHSCAAGIIRKVKETTGLEPEIVTLYGGARYHLYLYRRYTDIRLVMAPESDIASFGGEPENFEYPRHCLDLCFLRVYVDGMPLSCRNYLSWSNNGPQEGELLFVSGHPGKTERQVTAEHLLFLKNCKLPLILQYLNDKISALQTFAAQNAENERIASSDLRRSLNSLKVFAAQSSILANSSLIAQKLEQQAVFADLPPWKTISTAFVDMVKDYPAFFYFEGPGSNHSRLFRWARQLVRAAAEKVKPDNERLREYRDSSVATLELDLFSEEPIYDHFEQFTLQNSLSCFERILGNDCLACEAKEAISQPTKLADLTYRRWLYENPDEIANCRDPLILLALKNEPYSRELRPKQEQMETILRDCYAQIANTLQLHELTYPDATFTLRLTYGQMLGYAEEDQQFLPSTTFGSAFTHSKECNLILPKRWQENINSVDLETPFNFVSTHDIIGGNSGSPVVNLAGEVVGLIFDGNSHSLAWDLAFEQQQGRAISVHSQAIVEALNKIYHADRIVKEIKGHAKALQCNCEKK